MLSFVCVKLSFMTKLHQQDSTSDIWLTKSWKNQKIKTLGSELSKNSSSPKKMAATTLDPMDGLRMVSLNLKVNTIVV